MTEGTKKDVGVHPSERIEFGNARAEWVRLSDLNRLKQTRQDYALEGITELADSMVYEDDAGNRRFELIHDLTIGVFDDSELARYIDDHEDFYGEDVDTSSLTRGENGRWYVIIAGHRRSLAMEENCSRDDIPFDEAYIACSLKPGIQFEEALVLQLRENVHLRPPAVDEAKQIDRYYRLRSRREGSLPTIASCSRVLGFSESKVSEALRFAQLPEAVQHEAASGMISYTHAVELLNYVKVLEVYYQRKYAEAYADSSTDRTLKQDVSDGAMTLVKKLKSDDLQGFTAKKKSEVIKAHVNTITDQISYHDGELFVYEEDMRSPGQKLRGAEAKLSKQAMTILVDRLRRGSTTMTASERALFEELSTLVTAAQRPALYAVSSEEADLFASLSTESVA